MGGGALSATKANNTTTRVFATTGSSIRGYSGSWIDVNDADSTTAFSSLSASGSSPASITLRYNTLQDVSDISEVRLYPRTMGLVDRLVSASTTLSFYNMTQLVKTVTFPALAQFQEKNNEQFCGFRFVTSDVDLLDR